VKVDFWACCKERHANGGYHYHCSLKLTGSKKWVGVRNRLDRYHNVKVNFSAKHDYYLSSYRYVIKEDENVFHSENHPKDLASANSPLSKKGIKTSKQNAQKRRSESLGGASASSSSSSKKKRPVCLTNLNVADLVELEKIKNYTALLALANKRREAGQEDLANFVFSKTEKHLNELVKKTWAMHSAQAEIDNADLTHMDMLRAYSEQAPCSYPCDGEWLQCAREILELNHIPVSQFASSLHALLSEGRAKHRLCTDCGKTFILKPLQQIFAKEIFQNLANDKFSWVGADKARVIFLNDFRWTKEVIQ